MAVSQKLLKALGLEFRSLNCWHDRTQ
jgi:hypothetical protein